ncbi:MAG: cation:proton antiporter [Micrococcaceae bacterium]
MLEIEATTAVVVAAVIIIGVVANFSTRLGVAAPLTLVVVGTGLALLPFTPEITVDPHLVLAVIIPPLLYVAAAHVPFVDFRRNLTVISWLAIGLVVVSALIGGLLVHWLIPGVSFALALALGAVVAPPDAVAATSLGKKLGLPPRVLTILEGEGLVNDATALLLLSTALSWAVSGEEALSGWGIAGSFLWNIAGALIIGTATGVAAVQARRRIRDRVLDIAIALVTPFVAFLLTEVVSASGIVAVVFAGLVVGHRGPARISAPRRRTEQANWATFTMVVENGVFLMMGYLLPPVVATVAGRGHLGAIVGVGLLISAALIMVRFAFVPVMVTGMKRRAGKLARRHQRIGQRLEAIDQQLDDSTDERARQRLNAWRRRQERGGFDVSAERDQQLSWRDSVVLSTAGMRGVVTIAAAQTLPADHSQYHALVLVAFVVALVTLLPQGLLLPVIVRRVHPAAAAAGTELQEYRELMTRMTAAAARAVERSFEENEVDPSIQESFRDRIAEQRTRTAALDRHRDAELIEQFRLVRHAQLTAERNVLERERRRGEFSSESISRAQQVLDDHQIQLDSAPSGTE